MAFGTLRMLCDYVPSRPTFLPRCFMSKHSNEILFLFGAFSTSLHRIKMAQTKPNIYKCVYAVWGWLRFSNDGDGVSVFGFTHAETEHNFLFFGWHFPREISDCFYANRPFSLRNTYASPIYSARFSAMYMLVAIVICSIWLSVFFTELMMCLFTNVYIK